MVTYVRAAPGETWHWCTNCSTYPSNVRESRTRPPEGAELCDECGEKQVEGVCQEA